MELSPDQIQALLKEEGASASTAAAEELAEVLENYIGYITEEAIGLAREDGRDAITKQDIVEAEK
ncbi:MAG: histone-like protein [Candidatus Nanohaloarchaea archaeon]|nr:histone-like protein [Candidatus Nanohaloarchaea archaeon]